MILCPALNVSFRKYRTICLERFASDSKTGFSQNQIKQLDKPYQASLVSTENDQFQIHIAILSKLSYFFVFLLWHLKYIWLRYLPLWIVNQLWYLVSIFVFRLYFGLLLHSYCVQKSVQCSESNTDRGTGILFPSN